MSNILLTIAINQYAVAPLRGCINDSNNIANVLKEKGFEVTSLHDDQATKQNIIDSLTKIALSLKAGDHFILHYSGHGSQIPCYRNDEEDGLTEILCPFDLINKDGTWSQNYITDDEISSILNSIESDVVIECFFDCCHSGTATRDLMPNVVYRYIQPSNNVEPRDIVKFNPGKSNKIICWSGCRDDQTSADAYIDNTFQGAFTAALLKNNLSGTREQLYNNVVAFMQQNRFTQAPQLFCTDDMRVKEVIL